MRMESFKNGRISGRADMEWSILSYNGSAASGSPPDVSKARLPPQHSSSESISFSVISPPSFPRSSPSQSKTKSRSSRKGSINSTNNINQSLSAIPRAKDSENCLIARGSRLSQQERKLRRRQQNNESSRRVRERKRLEVKALQQAYVENQERIAELEQLVQKLSNELCKHNSTFKRNDRNRSSTEYQLPQSRPNLLLSSVCPSNNATSQFLEERPSWFGAAF